jgi:hypothetical protein
LNSSAAKCIDSRGTNDAIADSHMSMAAHWLAVALHDRLSPAYATRQPAPWQDPREAVTPHNPRFRRTTEDLSIRHRWRHGYAKSASTQHNDRAQIAVADPSRQFRSAAGNNALHC